MPGEPVAIPAKCIGETKIGARAEIIQCDLAHNIRVQNIPFFRTVAKAQPGALNLSAPRAVAQDHLPVRDARNQLFQCVGHFAIPVEAHSINCM